MARQNAAHKARMIAAALQSIATGKTLNAFCAAHDVPYATLWGWLTADDAVTAQRLKAMETGTHYLAGECLDIADGVGAGDKGGDGEGPLSARVQLAKLRIDTRLRLMAIWERKDGNAPPPGEDARPGLIELVSVGRDDDGTDPAS